MNGTAADGTLLTGSVQLGNTCIARPSDCSAPGQTFMRTVTAAPEPTRWALMAVGLVGLDARARRRRGT